MNEEQIIKQLTLNAFNYRDFGEERFKQAFTNWMYKLQHIKGFNSIEEACDYFIAQGEMPGEKLSA